MDEFQLRHLTTDDLLLLKQNVAKEIHIRKRKQLVEDRIDYVNKISIDGFDDIRILHQEVTKFNRTNLLNIPSFRTSDAHNYKKYLDDLINQDWSSIYPCDENMGEFYVYAHVDPRERSFVSEEIHGGNFGGKPFYIGKGSKNRAWEMKRNQGHGIVIKQIIEAGFPAEQIVKVIYKNLSEQKAFELESKLIYFFGLTYDKNRKSGWLLNLDIPKMPELTGSMIKYPGKKNTQMKARAKTRIWRGL